MGTHGLQGAVTPFPGRERHVAWTFRLGHPSALPWGCQQTAKQADPSGLITRDVLMTVNRAIWRDQLTASERSVLGRADDGVVGSRPDVLVIGGGILGVSIASACAAAGLGKVLLIETGRLGAGATGGATGLLIPEPH